MRESRDASSWRVLVQMIPRDFTRFPLTLSRIQRRLEAGTLDMHVDTPRQSRKCERRADLNGVEAENLRDGLRPARPACAVGVEAQRPRDHRGR